MQSDDDLQTTLSKWPFILGDVLLVGTALAIAILGDWQLSNWQVASCVISVALGAGLFVLPYIVEFQVRIREEAEDRTADLRIFQREIVSTQDQLEAVADRIQTLEGGLSDLAQARSDAEDLNAPIAALIAAPIATLEAKIDPLSSAYTAQNEQVEDLAKQVALLSQAIESWPGPETIEALQVELTALQSKVEELATQAVAAPEPDAPVEQDEAVSEQADAPVEPEQVVEPIAKKTRAPRQRRSPESGLLQRAIGQKQDESSAAVSRIIQSQLRKEMVAEAAASAEPDAAESQEIEAPAEPEPIVSPEPEPESEPLATEEADAPAESERMEADVPTEPELPAQQEVEASAESEPIVSPEPEAEPKPLATEEAAAPAESEPEVQPESNPESPASPESDDMFGDAVPVQTHRRPRTKKSDTAVIASVFIGIGNKPYVRGSGAGLNWESGLAMEFEEIGKWRWIAPADLEESLEIQLFRNDEDPDSTGTYTLEPGQQLELSPVF